MDKNEHKLPLREKKKLQAEHKITHCALQLFEKNGYNSVSIDDIAEAADISKGTFYNYFPTKEAVLLKISHNSIKKVNEALSAAPIYDDPIEMIKLCFQYLIDDIYMWRNVAREIAMISVSNEAMHDYINSLISKYVDDAQKKGIIRNDYKSEFITHSLMGIYYIAIFGLNQNVSHEESIQQINASYTFMLEGLLINRI